MRLIHWLYARFFGRPEDDYSMQPPFDLAFGGVVRNSADKTIREDRIRVGVFRPRRAKKCKDCGKACRWLVIEWLDPKGEWQLVISMQESRLAILLSVLNKVADYLAEDGGTTPRALPTVTVNGVTYFVDARLEEMRNIDDPHDRVTFGRL